MIVFNGAFHGKKLGAQTYYTPFPAAAGQAQAVYQPYPPGFTQQTGPKVVLPPSPVGVAQAYAEAADVPFSMVQAPAPVPVAKGSGSGISIAAAVVGTAALIASVLA